MGGSDARARARSVSTTLVYSPGYQVPLWLGDGQLRLWRYLDRELGARNYASTTVRAIARRLGVNPGSVARDLDALARLGYATHLAEWGRAGVRLWRVVARGGRRGLDQRKRMRALARMGLLASSPGQLALTTYGAGEPVPRPAPTAAGVRDRAPAAVMPTSSANVDRLHGVDAADDSAASEVVAAGPFGSIRCACGRSRLTRDGAVSGPCPHGRGDGVPTPTPPPNGDPDPEVDPTPSRTVACLDYAAHRFEHAYVGGRWVCYSCAGEAS